MILHVRVRQYPSSQIVCGFGHALPGFQGRGQKMEYVALFLWFSLCVLLGALMHRVMQGPVCYRLIALATAPGVVVRKSSQTLVAMLCGATVTDVRIYQISQRDIAFKADGVSSVAKVLVPLAPLFGCVLILGVLNSWLGEPLQFNYAPPPLPSLDAGGLKGLLISVGTLLSRLLRQTFRGDWRSAEFYVMLVLIFSLALGACQPVERVREALLGVALLVVSIALVSALVTPSSLVGRAASSPGRAQIWAATSRGFLVDCAGTAFALMLFGMLQAIAVGVGVRLYELLAGAPTRSGGATTSSSYARPQDRTRAA